MSEDKINGLKNLGNTCYINVVIQCLSYTVDMSNYFLSNTYLKDKTKNSKEDRTMLDSYVNLLKGLWYLDKTIAPASFVKKFKTVNKFSSDQQDSHEALITLIDNIHNSISRHVKMKIVDEDNDGNLSKVSWKVFFEKEYSEIIKLFYGQLYSYIKCPCNYTSQNYEPFCCISCELPKLNREIMVDDCLESFFLDESLNADYTCSNCKKQTSPIKKLSIKKLPNHLIIHFKRFIMMENGKYIKNNQHISFPIYLNMSKFVDKSIPKKDTVYHLYAVINHIGVMSSGHYYSYCKVPNNKWYCFNDENVDAIEKSKLDNKNAYILFYKKI